MTVELIRRDKPPDFDQNGWDAWVRSRPECVQKLIEEFPIASILRVDGELFYLIGWNEDDSLIISPVDPAEDYDGAIAVKEYLCAKHLRKEN